MVLDRLLFYLFSIAFVFGTFYIFLKAPRIHDTRLPIDFPNNSK